MDDALTLLDICLPELQAVLARQRQDYGLSEDFPAEYPVFQQAKNIDDTPEYNLAMERQSVDYLLRKLQTLPAVSRSVILGRAKELQGVSNLFLSFCWATCCFSSALAANYSLVTPAQGV